MVDSAACWLPFHVKMQLQELSSFPLHCCEYRRRSAARVEVVASCEPPSATFRHFCSSCAKTIKSGRNVTNLDEDGWPDTDVVFREVWLSLCHFFFWLLSGGSAISLSLFHVSFHISIFWWISKRKSSPSSKYVGVQGASWRSLRLPLLSRPHGSPLPPNSLIEDLSMCHPAFSVPGLVDANVAGMSDFPLTPLQSLQESSAQTKQQQAAGSNSSPEYRKLAAESHMFAIPCVCTRVRVCFVFGIS